MSGSGEDMSKASKLRQLYEPSHNQTQAHSAELAPKERQLIDQGLGTNLGAAAARRGKETGPPLVPARLTASRNVRQSPRVTPDPEEPETTEEDEPGQVWATEKAHRHRAPPTPYRLSRLPRRCLPCRRLRARS